MTSIPVTVTHGDGIGPEIMAATLEILSSACSKFEFHEIKIGESEYLKGHSTGISQEAWEVIKSNKLFLKAPITTPQGGGYKSLNVAIRKGLELYANVRPCLAYHPFVKTNFPDLDVVIVRENAEDLYMGIEYQVSPDVAEAKKVITRAGSEGIVRYAFDYAVKNRRKKVTCMTKDNIMKLTDGLFHKVFDEVSKSYPNIENDHYIIDIGSARLAHSPQDFDVVVTLNLYGDIISDIVAEVSGSVGLAGSANIGQQYAMFEAIHGSAPSMAGQNKANPSGLLNGAIMMLAHSGQGDVATAVRNGLLTTIESGCATGDVYTDGVSKQLMSTSDFAKEIVKNLGKKPGRFAEVVYPNFEFDAKVVANDKEINVESNDSGSGTHNSDLFYGADITLVSRCYASQFLRTVKSCNLSDKVREVGIELESIGTRGIGVIQDGHVLHEIHSDFWICKFKNLKSGRSFGDFLTALIGLLSPLEGMNCSSIHRL